MNAPATCTYGSGGALVTDAELPQLGLYPLPSDAAAFYGGRYLIAESMSRTTAQALAAALGLVLQPPTGETL